MFLLLAYIFSTLVAINFAVSFKRMLEMFFECYLLYIVIIACDQGHFKPERLLKSALLGLVLIAALSPFEYYIGLNIIGIFLPVMFDKQGVISTYQHSIHFGYAMAMGVPIAVVFTNRAKTISERLLYSTSVAALLIGCYFSFSRGALLGAMLAIALILLFGGKALRKTSITLFIIIILALIFRPGVRVTLFDMINSLFAHNGVQDASAEYRKILWTVAWSKISESPISLLFGLGGGSTELMDISDFFGARRGGNLINQGYSSWDSQWAANLVQFGIVGFGAEVLFWLKAMLRLSATWFREKSSERDLLLFAVLVGCAVYLWAMLTVAIFSPQLRYLTAIYLSCGFLLTLHDKSSHTANFASSIK